MRCREYLKEIRLFADRLEKEMGSPELEPDRVLAIEYLRELLAEQEHCNEVDAGVADSEKKFEGVEPRLMLLC